MLSSESLAALIPVLVALCVSANTIPGDFIFDDTVIVEGDQRLRDFDPRRVFRENYWGTAFPTPNWRPLTLFTFALNHQATSEAWAFHAVNVALNAAAAGAFYFLLRALSASRWASAAGASVFAALPIHSEAVANIVGRAELLAALGVFGAWRLALRERASAASCAAILVLVLLGMLSKENAAAAVPLIVLSGWLLRRSILWRPALSALAAVGSYFLLYRLLLVDSPLGPQGVAFTDNPLAGEPAAVRVLNGVRLLGLYAARTVLPLRLSADHSYDALPVLPLDDLRLWWQAGLTVLVFVLPAALAWRRAPAIAIGFLTFLVAFAPTSNLLFPLGTIFAERLAFLPSAGWAIALASGFDLLRKRGKAWRRTALIIGVGLVAAYGARTVLRNRVWSDPVTFGLRLPLDSPGSARAHLKAAEARLQLAHRAQTVADRDEQLRLAEGEVEAAAAIKENEAFAHRAMLHVERERYDQALEWIKKARDSYRQEKLELDPDILLLQARVLFFLGRLPEAIAELEGYSRRKRELPAPALYLRGVCLMGLGKLPEAQRDFVAAVRLDPAKGEYRMHRGILLAQLGRTDEARRELDQAVLLSPENPQVYSNRGYLRFLTADTAGALADYRAGLALCERRGRLVARQGEDSALSFRLKIFDVLLRSGDREGARSEVTAIRAIPRPEAAAAAIKLEARLAEGR